MDEIEQCNDCGEFFFVPEDMDEDDLLVFEDCKESD
jgi:hypothetical protein